MLLLAAAAVLQDWKGGNESSPFSKLDHNFGGEDTTWTPTAPSVDSLFRAAQVPAFPLIDSALGESCHFLSDAFSYTTDWEAGALERDSERSRQEGSWDVKNGLSDAWTEGFSEGRATKKRSGGSPQTENGAPSRWQYPTRLSLPAVKACKNFQACLPPACITCCIPHLSPLF